MGRLSVAKVRSAGPGRHGDGDGLYLLVKPSLSRSWVLRIQQGHARRDIGLGAVDVTGRDGGDPIHDVPLLQRRVLTLAEARGKAAMLRQLSRAGLDPLVERDRERRKLEIPTFARAIDLAHAELEKGMELKEARAFKATLETHAVPKLGERRVDQIGAEHVIEALARIWTDKPHQARKVRRRILRVLAFARSKGWRSEALPLAGEISDGLAKQPRAANFKAMPYRDVPAYFAAELARSESPARLALLFAILTASRSGEVRQARWEQIDLEGKLWRCPPEIMKARREHVVTLSTAAVRLLEIAARRYGREGFVFPSAKPGSPLSDMSLSKMLRSAGIDATVHGFRASFRNWAAEQMSEVPAEVAEIALAHLVGDKTQRAYMRSDLSKQRAQLLEAWGEFVSNLGGGDG